MHRRNPLKQKGFIALTSAIILSAILMLIAVTSGFTSFSSRVNILDAELKERSDALAEACWDIAILNLSKDSGYNPVDEVKTIGTDDCVIKSISGGSNKLFKVQGRYKSSYFTNLEIIWDTSTSQVTSWKEVASF